MQERFDWSQQLRFRNVRRQQLVAVQLNISGKRLYSLEVKIFT